VCMWIMSHVKSFFFLSFKFLTFLGCMNVGHGLMFKNLPTSLLREGNLMGR
jgi:hypothetical protein